MSYLVYLTLLPPIIIGGLLASWLLLPTRNVNFLLLLSTGIPLGFGVVACLYFFWFEIFNPAIPGFIWLELAIIAALVYVNWKHRKYLFEIFAAPIRNRNKLDWVFGILFLLIAFIGIAAFINYTTANPHGRYDAWAIWTVRARMFFRSGEYWKSIFVPQVFHADYPLLVPLTIAHSWILAGTESQRIPPAVAGLFTFSSAGILVGSLFSMAKKQISWLAGILLLSTPWVIYFGSLQFSDLPLAAYILAASSSLCLALIDRDNSSRWLILAGLSAGFAAWTKNEGQMFLLVFLAVAFISIILVFKQSHPFRLIGRMIIGLLLPIMAILVFKLTLAPANDLVDPGNLTPVLTKLFSISRYGEVLQALHIYHKGFGGWLIPIPVVFLVLWLVLQPRINSENKAAILTLAFILILQWVGYFMIYVITPHDLQTHVNQSYDRLLMHLYPSFVLFMFLFLRPLKKIISPIRKLI